MQDSLHMMIITWQIVGGKTPDHKLDGACKMFTKRGEIVGEILTYTNASKKRLWVVCGLIQEINRWK